MTYKCPKCDSEKLIVKEVTSYYFNTEEFFCHSVKSHDSDAVVECTVCWWEGTRADFKEVQ